MTHIFARLWCTKLKGGPHVYLPILNRLMLSWTEWEYVPLGRLLWDKSKSVSVSMLSSLVGMFCKVRCVLRRCNVWSWSKDGICLVEEAKNVTLLMGYLGSIKSVKKFKAFLFKYSNLLTKLSTSNFSIFYVPQQPSWIFW